MTGIILYVNRFQTFEILLHILEQQRQPAHSYVEDELIVENNILQRIILQSLLKSVIIYKDMS